MDLRDYYDDHWTHVPEGQVDYSRLQIRAWMPSTPGERVLDSGCGPGFLAALLNEHGVRRRRHRRVVRRARADARAGASKPQQVDLDTDPLPFADGEFDAVVANSNLEHLFYMHRHIAECARCVKPGGKFIWLVPNIGHWRYRLWLLSGRFPYVPNSPTDEYHIRYMTAYEGRKLLRDAGARHRSSCEATPGRGCGACIRACSSTSTRSDTSIRRTSRSSGFARRLFARYLCFYAVKRAEP